MSYELIDSIDQDCRLGSIPSSVPDSIITFKSSFYFFVFKEMNSFKAGKVIGLVNSTETSPLAEMVPIRISGGLGPLLSPPEAAAAAAYLASSLYFRIVAKN